MFNFETVKKYSLSVILSRLRRKRISNFRSFVVALLRMTCSVILSPKGEESRYRFFFPFAPLRVLRMTKIGFFNYLNFRKLTVYLMLAVLVSGGAAGHAAAVVKESAGIISAEGAMIAEAKNGNVLFQQNADKRFEPASTVKIMTAIVAVENMPADSEITPTASVTRVEPTVIKLRSGVRYKLRDLIAAILIKSANDASLAIAEGVAGSEEAFVRIMNQKALEIGMNDTNFMNASGLPAKKRDDAYTTARDLVTMMRYALRHKLILDTMRLQSDDIQGSDNKRIHLFTHNKSLLSESGALWGKTGYTKTARRTFVGVDPADDPRIIVAILKSNELWDDIAALKKLGIELYVNRRRSFIARVIEWVSREK